MMKCVLALILPVVMFSSAYGQVATTTMTEVQDSALASIFNEIYSYDWAGNAEGTNSVDFDTQIASAAAAQTRIDPPTAITALFQSTAMRVTAGTVIAANHTTACSAQAHVVAGSIYQSFTTGSATARYTVNAFGGAIPGDVYALQGRLKINHGDVPPDASFSEIGARCGAAFAYSYLESDGSGIAWFSRPFISAAGTQLFHVNVFIGTGPGLDFNFAEIVVPNQIIPVDAGGYIHVDMWGDKGFLSVNDTLADGQVNVYRGSPIGIALPSGLPIPASVGLITFTSSRIEYISAFAPDPTDMETLPPDVAGGGGGEGGGEGE